MIDSLKEKIDRSDKKRKIKKEITKNFFAERYLTAVLTNGTKSIMQKYPVIYHHVTDDTGNNDFSEKGVLHNILAIREITIP